MLEKRKLSPRQKHLLKQFVNRRSELQQFRDMLECDDHLVMFVTGKSDVGKSTFLARMVEECGQHDWYCAVVSCDLMTNVDYRSIMRKLRNELGRDHFETFSDEDKERGQPKFDLALSGNGGVSVLDEGEISGGASVGDIIGVQVHIPKESLDEMERDRRAALTDSFIGNLSDITRDNPVVFFFDAVEKMPKETEAWVMKELVVAALDGTIRNVRFVHCGLRKPSIDKDHAWSVTETELRPLADNDVAEYLKKRGVVADDGIAIARQLIEKTDGYAGRVAKFVDAFEAQLES